MKKTLLLAAAAVVGASIVAIAGISARPSLLATDVKAGATKKTFAFDASNASKFSDAFEGDEQGGGAFVPEIDTKQGTPLQDSSLTVFNKKSSAFGVNGHFFECETDETEGNPHQTQVIFSFQVNNLTDLTIVYGVVNSEDEYECDPNSDPVNRYHVDLTKYGDDSGETLLTAYSSELTALEHKSGDCKATWSWDGSRTDDSTGAVRVIMIGFGISDRHTTSFYIESISFSWSC